MTIFASRCASPKEKVESKVSTAYLSIVRHYTMNTIFQYCILTFIFLFQTIKQCIGSSYKRLLDRVAEHSSRIFVFCYHSERVSFAISLLQDRFYIQHAMYARVVLLALYLIQFGVHYKVHLNGNRY
jgi:hypothetical protein